jgi:hypothetical protein
MADNEMVRRVAAAIEAADTKEIEDRDDWYQLLARAAIEAMREPTEAMKEAGEHGPTTLSYGDEDSFYYISKDDAESCWQSMLDAALSPLPATEERNG